MSFQTVLALVAVGSVAAAQGAQSSTNVITGTLDKVDSDAKTIAVKTADGTVETMKFNEKTTVQGLVVSKAREHTILAHAPCLLALPIQH